MRRVDLRCETRERKEATMPKVSKNDADAAAGSAS